MIRTWVYLLCWAILAVIVSAWSDDPESLRPAPALAAFLVLLPWVLDFVLARRSLRQSGWTIGARLFNFLPMLILIANVLLVWASQQPPEVRHNLDHEMAAQLVGTEAPILETWYSQDLVFPGHGSEFLRIRFSRERRAAIEAALVSHCRVAPASEVRWSLLSTSRPIAKSMPWDPRSTPTAPRLCGPDPGFQTDFGSEGDSLLLYYEGH
jgi:hypothetical protein